MKLRRAVVALLSLLLVLFFIAPVYAGQTVFQLVLSQNTLFVNGKLFSSPDLPILKYNGNNYIPLRAVGEALGAEIQYDNNTGAVNIYNKNSETEKTVEEIAKNVESTVFISTYDTYDMASAKLISSGSGIVLDNGIIVTNFHVIGDGLRYGIVYNDTDEGQEYRTSSWISINPSRDIGVIPSPDINEKPVKLGNSDELKLGEKVVAIGSPLGLKNTVSEGIISGFRKINGYNFIQITAPISPGSSGGGLFNTQGELIGITTLKIVDGESLNFAIPINDVKTIINNKDTQLEIGLNNLMSAYTYNNNSFFFNYISSIDEDGYYNVSYYLLEEYEGSDDFIELYENSADFRSRFSFKLAEITQLLNDSGYNKHSISIYSENKGVKFKFTDGKIKKEFDTFMIK